ncbi:hypothetical protein O430_00655, partial [Staphylococcus aureus M0298]
YQYTASQDVVQRYQASDIVKKPTKCYGQMVS